MLSRLLAIGFVLAVFQQLVADSSVIKVAQQADTTLSPLVTALAQGYSLSSGIATGLKHSFLGEGALYRMFHASSSCPGHLQVVIPAALKLLCYSSFIINQVIWVHKTLYKRYRSIITGLDRNQTLLFGYRNVGNASGDTLLKSHNKHHWSQLLVSTPFRSCHGISWDPYHRIPLASSMYVVVVTYLFSKWVEALPLKSIDNETLASLLVTEIVCRCGVLCYLHSDQGVNLTSNLMATVCNHLGIAQT